MAKQKSRRDFIFVATGAVGVFGAGALTWPMISSMKPAADSQQPSLPIVDLSEIEEGQQLKVIVRGKPVFIRHRTPEEIRAAQDADMTSLPVPERDQDRTVANLIGEKDFRYIVLYGACPHMGAILIGESGDYEGWYCPSHGNHYDTSGRFRKGITLKNMAVPPYKYISTHAIQFLLEPAGLELLSRG